MLEKEYSEQELKIRNYLLKYILDGILSEEAKKSRTRRSLHYQSKINRSYSFEEKNKPLINIFDFKYYENIWSDYKKRREKEIKKLCEDHIEEDVFEGNNELRIINDYLISNGYDFDISHRREFSFLSRIEYDSFHYLESTTREIKSLIERASNSVNVEDQKRKKLSDYVYSCVLTYSKSSKNESEFIFSIEKIMDRTWLYENVYPIMKDLMEKSENIRRMNSIHRKLVRYTLENRNEIGKMLTEDLQKKFDDRDPILMDLLDNYIKRIRKLSNITGGFDASFLGEEYWG